MAELLEACQRCGWSHHLSFVYHGGVPVEHPLCPACGQDLRWEYTFDPAEAGGDPERLRSTLALDEAGLPEDRSPEVLRLQRLIEGALSARTGDALRITNIGGHVDLELRPYIDAPRGLTGAKAIACVGHAALSTALLELLAQLNASLAFGAVIPGTSPYGAPVGAAAVFPAGTPVSLLYQHVIPEADLHSGAWFDQWQAASEAAQQTAHLFTAPLAPLEGMGYLDTPDASEGEARTLDALEHDVLDPLLRSGPDAEELRDRLRSFLIDLELEAPEAEAGFLFALRSARVRVGPVERGGRLLARFWSVLLSELDLHRLHAQDPELAPRLLTRLNDQLLLGRCVLEPQGYKHQIVYETTLLAADLDLSEFAVTLAVLAEQADRMDDILQEGFGGLRADQLEGLTAHRRDDEEPPCDVTPLLERLTTGRLPGVVHIGVEGARELMRELLEELRVTSTEDAAGNLWFTFGSARICGNLWEDERATWLALSSPVLRNVERPTGLAAVLNDLNRAIPTGAFALQEDRHVLLLQTLLMDDLSTEELAYALVTLGELADHYDNILQERFGGQLASEPTPLS